MNHVDALHSSEDAAAAHNAPVFVPAHHQEDTFEAVEYSYPSITQGNPGDDSLHVTYTYSEHVKRRAIRYKRVTEEWVMAGGDVAEVPGVW